MKAKKQVIRRACPSEHNLPSTLKDVTCRVLAGRGVLNTDQLDLSLSKLFTNDKFSGIYKAADIIIEVAESKGKILIVGDYDADGATSTALGLLAFSSMGIEHIDHLIPNRFDLGYGLSPELVEVAHKLHQPDLILTVDNGITSVNAVERAKEIGIKVVITDHHLPGDRLPAADALVNPCLEGNAFESNNLAGVGVVFYLLGAIRERLKSKGWFAKKSIEVPKLVSFIDLVALGTVADLVSLDQNNRRMVQAGLRLIRSGKGNLGILALLSQAGRNLATLTAEDLAYSVAPQLNAAGRMSNMSLGIECLLATDKAVSVSRAQKLFELNNQRKLVERNMQDEAIQIVGEIVNNQKQQVLPDGFCLYKEDWHEGVVGIVASRVKEIFHRPTVVFAKGKNGVLKGSARSIKGLHIRDVLAEIANEKPTLISRFGGHAMAAGLSLSSAKITEFRELFSSILSKQMNESLLQEIITTDGSLDATDFDLELAQELSEVSPWGQGFPAPTFDGVFDIIRSRVVGIRHVSLLLGVPNSAQQVSAIAFNALEESWWVEKSKVKLIFRLTVNDYRDRESLQLNILHGALVN